MTRMPSVASWLGSSGTLRRSVAVAAKGCTGQARIQVRIDRLALGNPGYVKPVGGGISEMRVDFGPGCSVYSMQHGDMWIVLLAGGDKSTQARDIDAARIIADQWRDRA